MISQPGIEPASISFSLGTFPLSSGSSWSSRTRVTPFSSSIRVVQSFRHCAYITYILKSCCYGSYLSHLFYILLHLKSYLDSLEDRGTLSLTTKPQRKSKESYFQFILEVHKTGLLHYILENNVTLLKYLQMYINSLVLQQI